MASAAVARNSSRAKTRASRRRVTPARALYLRIRQILESARTHVARTVDTTQVVSNWLVGREIVDDEQKGARRAGYGEELLVRISINLQRDYGSGYSAQNLRYMRQFYLTYPELLPVTGIRRAARGKLVLLPFGEKRHALRGNSWKPGRLHSNLGWTHYRTLLRVDRQEARAFYEIEAIKNNWGGRELERQINSLLYERLALSRDKKGLMKLATKGQRIQQPADIFKDAKAA